MPNANPKEGTNKNLSPTVAPFTINKLFVGDEAIKKNKIEKASTRFFLNFKIAKTNKLP